MQIQGDNIWRYSEYLLARAKAYADTHADFVRDGGRRLKRLTVAKGLLRETEVVQKQIQALLRCDFIDAEPENEVSLTAFRLVTLDLLTLYSVMNEGVINVLGVLYVPPGTPRATDRIRQNTTLKCRARIQSARSSCINASRV